MLEITSAYLKNYFIAWT